MQHTLTLTDAADDADRRAVLAPLVAFNTAQTGPYARRPIAVLVRDVGSATGAISGGLWGHTGYDWLYVQLLVVPADARGQGLGTRIMQMAEDEARIRGCRGAWLDTFEFQARGFYERLGYACFGEIADYPAGFSRFFMKKTWATAAS